MNYILEKIFCLRRKIPRREGRREGETERDRESEKQVERSEGFVNYNTTYIHGGIEGLSQGALPLQKYNPAYGGSANAHAHTW